MSLSEDRIFYLLERYTSQQASAAEEAELMDFILEAKEDSALKAYMQGIWELYKPTENVSDVNWTAMFARVTQSPVVDTAPPVRRMNWSRIAAAAVILIAVTGITYRYFAPRTKEPVATLQPRQIDIAPPAKNKALLTLADGTKIELDSSGNGTLAMQGSVRVVKRSDGEINYAGPATGDISYNTLSVPKGSRPLNLVLSDGSRVWLNLGSSLTYPTAFAGKERKVKITGEAYFEIAHNTRMPFMVTCGDVTLQVLGTHFNVNAYEDETARKITLLEGSVRVTQGTSSAILKPGQQAQVSSDVSDIKVKNDVDVEEVMAWKSGKFGFGGYTDIGAIMRQVARWYNVEVEYQGGINHRFWGSISKDVNVSEVLKVLEATGGVKFNVQGNKITVMPAAR